MPQSSCNPLNLDYRFQVEGWAPECHREAADPSVVFFRGRFWMFVSKSGGYWHSADMRVWEFVETRVLPTEDYAPDARVINGWLHVTVSRSQQNCPVYRTQAPEKDAWELVSEPFIYWDPNLFQDDDGRVYMYWGCSNKEPVRGVEMESRSLLRTGAAVDLIHGAQQQHGWERFADDNDSDEPPYVEGPWMTKHGGRYYLQYAAPGTQWNVYGDGVYVGDNPLGPFTYQVHNPFSFKPGGFITGAGHGSTFQDTFGNWWHAATMRISVKHRFERRLGIFPAGFDADGVMFCNTRFADWPQRHAAGVWDSWRDAWTGWLPLGWRAAMRASSEVPGHGPELAADEDIRTWWSAASGTAGEWLEMDLGAVCTLNAVQINFAEHNCHQFARQGGPLMHQYLLEHSADGRRWQTAVDRRENRRDVPHDYIEFAAPLTARHLRLTNTHMPAGGHFAVSGLRPFGRAPGAPPPTPELRLAERDRQDPAVARLAWDLPAGAVGCNLRWGVAPDKLYNDWLLYGRSELTLRALNAGTDCWLAIEAFNRNGVSSPSNPILLKA